jgi:hypothetical protein
MMRSPIWSVGSIEPDGMKNICATQVRTPTASNKATTTTATHSRTHRPLWGPEARATRTVSDRGGVTGARYRLGTAMGRPGGAESPTVLL